MLFACRVIILLFACISLLAASGRSLPRSVALWADLASEDINAHWQDVFVREDGKAGWVTAFTTASLPARAANTNLAIADPSGTGMWVRQLVGITPHTVTEGKLLSGTLSGAAWLTPGVDQQVQVLSSVDSTPQLYLSTTNAVPGSAWRVVNQDVTNTLDCFDPNTNLLFRVPQASWADFQWDTVASNYVLTANSYLGDEFWDDLRIPLLSAKLAGSQDPDLVKITDDGAGSTGVYAYAFDKNIEEEVYFSTQVPHNWKEGTDIKLHLHWSPSDTTVTNIVWGCEVAWGEANDAFPSSTLYYSTNETAGIDRYHALSAIATLDGSGRGVSGVILGRLFRHATNSADTYPADVFATSLDFHYIKNKLGESTH